MPAVNVFTLFAWGRGRGRGGCVCVGVFLTLIRGYGPTSSSPRFRPLPDLFKFQYLVMEASNTDRARLYLSRLSWCQAVHSINTATVYAIAAPENEIDCGEDVEPTDVMWCS